ncbi:ankyrin-1-like [Ruditapes philippinarum]|uniref:ankyrin-1-like n=1 Tax=Ruditapes philippinarum TaxID=129788 RepID=UPI00295BFDE3|nr:ankyrin-1-like [Ruditapes philippinarum]
MMFAQMPFMNDDIKTCIDIFDKDMCKSDPYGCLDQCLIVPLNKMSKPKDIPVIIIIDGLDECFDDSRGVNDILRILQKRLHLFPLWIKFLVSTRPDPRIKHLTVDLHVMRLNDFSRENMNDIVMYRKHLSSNMSVSFTNKYKNINVSNFLLLSLLNQSSGTIEAVQSGALFPSSLYVFYEHQFQRFFTSKYEETFINSKTILEVIYSSFEPPTRDKVWLIVSDVTSMTFKQFNLSFQLLDNFFHKIENEIHFFHLSFREWLIDESNIDFSIDIECGHELNALHIFQQIEYGNFENDIIDLVMHVDLSFSKALHQQFLSVPKLTMLQTEQNKDEYPLFRLVRRRDSSEAINLLMYHFEDIDARNKDNVTALYIAASLGHVKAFNALILKGSNVSFRTNSYSKIINFEEAFTVSIEHQHWDYGIMDIAAQHGHENVVKYVLKNNNHLFNYPITRYNSMHLLPIHLACKKGHTTIVKLLHSKYKWMLDWQCLYYASEIGRLCLVNYILDNGIEDKCYKCESHMSWIKKGQLRVQGHVFRDSEVMDKGLSFVLLDDWANITCESALHIAVRENKLDVVNILINKSKRTSFCYDRGGKTPVISALQYGNQGIVEYFLSIGILTGNETCATIRPLNDSFKLHEKEVTRIGKSFCENHMTVPHILAKYNHIILSHMLIRSGIALNWMTRDMEGCYPIHLAACHGSVEMLSYLLKHLVMHFELFMCANGSTALHSAVEWRSPSSTKILLMHNKNYSGESKSKMFMYIKLAMNTSYEPELASNYMDIEIRISKIIFMLISKDWDFNITDAFGRNILHYAITQGHFKVVLELFKNFRDESNILLEAEDIDNRTPLRYALLKLKPFSSFFLPNQSFGNSTFGPTDESIDQMTANDFGRDASSIV